MCCSAGLILMLGEFRRYGRDAQQSTHLATHAARNIVLIYVDMLGFARRALITKAGKEFVKARVSSKDKAQDAGNNATGGPAPEKA